LVALRDLLLVGRLRVIDGVAALVQVRACRGDEGGVLLLVTLRHPDRRARIARAGRDRRRGRKREQEREVPRRLGELYLKGLRIRRGEPADGVGLAARD